MTRLPTLFISHGAPTFAIDPGRAGPLLTALGRALPHPAAVLVVSPHWTTSQVQVATSAQPRTIHDFGGFDRALYQLDYPAVGHPTLAARTIDVLSKAGIAATSDPQWGLDHGAWVPLRYLYPQADVPVFQVSMPRALDATSAYRFGAALAPLADEGVLIVGSGSLTHNLYEFRGSHGGEEAYAREFAHWIREAVLAGDHTRLQNALALAPHAERAHPSTEHFLPLLIAAGAAGSEGPVAVIDGGIQHGVLSMESYAFGVNQEALQNAGKVPFPPRPATPQESTHA